MPEVQIDNHFKRGTTDHLIRSHNCSVTNTESFAIAPQRIRSHLLLLRSEYGDYFDTESSNCANSPLCTVSLRFMHIAQISCHLLSSNFRCVTTNIARGTTDPEIESVTWIKFCNNKAPLAPVANLSTRWRHLHWLQI